MSNVLKNRKEASKNKSKVARNSYNDHSKFLYRVTKSLYYGKLPTIPCLSLPVTELSAEIFSESQKGKSLRRLYVDDAAELTRNACVSPCSLVLALLYLERLKNSNPEYVARMAPAELFLVSLMVSNKFILEDGEDDSVYTDEWAASAGITCEALNQIERSFLNAIDWQVFVSENNFENALEWLEEQVALRQSRLRGWFTYGDLANITNALETVNLMKCLVTVYIALSVSYLASISTLLASTIIVSQSMLSLSKQMESLNIIEPSTRCQCDSNIDSNENSTSDYLTYIQNDNIYESDMLPSENVDHLIISNIYSTSHYIPLNVPSNNETLLYTHMTHMNYHKWITLGNHFFNCLLQILNKIQRSLYESKDLENCIDYGETKKLYSNNVLHTEPWHSLSQYRENPYSIMWQYPRTISVSC